MPDIYSLSYVETISKRQSECRLMNIRGWEDEGEGTWRRLENGYQNTVDRGITYSIPQCGEVTIFHNSLII
jgi:hypothetical protein